MYEKTLNKSQSFDLGFLEQYEATVNGRSIFIVKELSQANIDVIEAHINEMTLDERRTDNARIENETAIIAKADAHIEKVYSPKKQRKLMSIAVELIDKKTIRGATHTPEEATMLQSIRDTNTWITAVRVIENAAIINGTSVDEVSF